MARRTPPSPSAATEGLLATGASPTAVSPEAVRLLDAIPAAAVLVDEEGYYVHANPAAGALFGRPARQIVGSRMGERAADPRAVRLALESLRANGRAEGRVQATGPDGGVVHVGYRLVADVLPGLSLGLLSDVTDQVEAETARSDLAAVVAASVDAIVGLDRDAVVRSWNPAAERLYGYTEEEAVGRGIAELIVPDDREDEVRANIDLVTRGGTVRGMDTVRRRRDGTLVDVSLTMAPVVDTHGTVTGFSIIHRDVTERIRAQAALAESERNLRLIAENSRDAFFAYDMDRRLLYANSSTEDLYGYTPEEIREAGFIEWGHPDDRARIRRLWDGLFEGKAFADEEYRIVARDGAQKWVAGTWGPMLDEEGRQVGVQGIDRDITDRKRAEEALRRTSERYRTLVEQLPTMTYITQLNPLSTIFISPQAESITGFTQQRWLEDPGLWRRQIHPDDRDRVLEAWERFLAERSTFAEGYRFMAGDGGVRWLQDVAVVLETGPGHAQQIQGIILDVTAQRRLDDRLRESERRIRLILEGVELVAVTTDLRGQISYVNEHFCRVTGYAEDELLERNWDEVFVPDDDRSRSEWVSFLASLAEGRVRPKGNGVLVTRAGEHRTMQWVNTELRDPAGRIEGLISLGLDVTEQLAAQRALAEAEEMHRSVVETALDAVITSDAEGRILAWNRQAEETFGWSREEAIGRDIGELIVPDGRRLDHQLGLARVSGGGVTRMLGHRVEQEAIHRDGHRFPVELAISASGRGRTLRFHAFIRDISERKRTEAELRANVEVLRESMRQRELLLARLQGAQEDERRRIAGDIHDDSIQVMAAAAMRLSMLRRRMGSDGPVEAIEQIEGIVQTAIERLRHLLFELRPAALDREGLSSALRMYLGVMSQETGIAAHLEDGLAVEPGTEVRTALYRVAQEALTNVRKHAQATRVDVTVLERDRGIVLRIRDDGRGFVVEEADRPAPGHLGLTAMRERVEALGGWCSVESAPGAGTTVELWVPIAPSPVPGRERMTGVH